MFCPLLSSADRIAGPVRETAAGLKAGVARIDITPEKPVNMSGYARRKGLSTGVHDPLSARAVAFEAGGKRLVLISTDIIGFYEARRRHASGASGRMQLAAFGAVPLRHSYARRSHADAQRERGHANNVEYTEGLKLKLIEVVRQALANMEPVKLGLGVGSCPVGGNRRELRVTDKGESSIVLGRNPYGTTDKEVLVVKVAKADGAPLAVMFDYATHGTVARHRQPTRSAAMCRAWPSSSSRRSWAPDVIAPIFIGASGNIDPWFRVLNTINEEPGWIPEPVLLGTLPGRGGRHVYRAIRQTNSADKIATNFVTLQLPAKPPDDRLHGEEE